MADGRDICAAPTSHRDSGCQPSETVFQRAKGRLVAAPSEAANFQLLAQRRPKCNGPNAAAPAPRVAFIHSCCSRSIRFDRARGGDGGGPGELRAKDNGGGEGRGRLRAGFALSERDGVGVGVGGPRGGGLLRGPNRCAATHSCRWCKLLLACSKPSSSPSRPNHIVSPSLKLRLRLRLGQLLVVSHPSRKRSKSKLLKPPAKAS